MESKNNEKKVLIFSTIAVVLLIIVVVGATYAFFTAQGGASANTNVNVQTNTTDSLSFSVGEAISITANQQNFAQGAGNQAGSTTASATLTANNATNTATRNYYLYLYITSNDFVYTVDENTPELLLTIIGPEGNPVTSLAGLNYKTDVTTNVTAGDAQTVSGFDITTKTGSITIADNYEISATETPTTQEWNVTVTFINLDSDQEGNTNKTFETSLVIREDSPIGITNVSTSNITSDSITLTVNAESENNITNYYFAKNEEEYVSSTSNTYTFSGLDAGTEYTLKAYAVDDEGYQSAVYSTEVSTTDYTLADVCPDGGNLAGCIQTYYTTYGEETGGIYYHDGVGTYTNANQEAGDNSYRYSGANPNNYVCFGATGDDCQNADNQYRIIGVFNNQVKLIKATSIGIYAWNGTDYTAVNTWDGSTKPDIYTTLNTTYYNTLESEWQNLIAESTWQVGGMEFSNTNTVKQYYDVEVGTGQSGYEETMKIGLMYVSDYGYGASPENWTTPLYASRYGTDNWLYLGDYEWTISRRSDDTYYAFSANGLGYVYNSTVPAYYGVRPSFSLASTVEITSGTGTSIDPFILNLG